MTVYEFIFSETKKIKFKRHLFFWSIWSVWIFNRHVSVNTPKDLLTLRPYIFGSINLFLWLPLSIVIVSLFIEILIPQFLIKEKYGRFFSAAILLCIGDMFISAILAAIYMDHVFNVESGKPAGDFRTHAIFMLTFLHSILIDFSLIFVASAIKIAKVLYLQQVESTRLIKERSENEIKITKSRIHPAFLLQSLKTIHTKILKKEPEAPHQILQLSELLSFILYDCNEGVIPLAKEIEMLRIFIDMQNMNEENKLKLLLNTSGDIEKKSIWGLSIFAEIQGMLEQYGKQKEADGTFTIKLQIEDKSIGMHNTAIFDENVIEKELTIAYINQV